MGTDELIVSTDQAKQLGVPFFPSESVFAAPASEFHLPVQISYNGTPPVFLEGKIEPVLASTFLKSRLEAGRKSRRTARLTARYLRAAAKREAKP